MSLSGKENPKMRLQVFLSRNGVCSRRAALNLILDGRVTVNGKVVREPSARVDSKEAKVCFDGKPVRTKKYDYILLNKPAGYVTTRSDRFAKKVVYDLLPQKFHHLAPAGRLDKDTQGLLLLTNDGDTAYKLTHPKFNVDKVYQVKVAGLLDQKEKAQLEKGVWIDGKKTAPAKITNPRPLRDETEFTITIHEGRKRQIRLMCARVGKKVIFLKRATQGPLSLGALKTGEWRDLTASEIVQLNNISE